MNEKNKIDHETMRRLSQDVLDTTISGEDLPDALDAPLSALDEKPVFYKKEKQSETVIKLDEELKSKLPQEFFDNPTEWIESHQPIFRGEHDEACLPKGETVSELIDRPYDVSKVKIIELEDGDVKIVSKRLDEKNGDEELESSRQAYKAGMPTPAVLGEIKDQGNHYAFFENIDGINLNSAIEKMREKGFYLHGSQYDPFTTSISKEGVEKEIDDKLSFLSEKSKEKIIGIWKEYLTKIQKHEMSILIENFITNFSIFKSEHIVSTIIKRIEKNKPVFLEILKENGFNSIEELKVFLLSEEQFSDNVDILINTIKSKCNFNSGELIDRIKVIVEKEIFGFAIKEEKNKIKEQCEKVDILHKDFERRNFVVPWDFENDVPKKQKDDEAKLYVVDWESEDKK